jgi:hypothetical protein
MPGTRKAAWYGDSISFPGSPESVEPERLHPIMVKPRVNSARVDWNRLRIKTSALLPLRRFAGLLARDDCPRKSLFANHFHDLLGSEPARLVGDVDEILVEIDVELRNTLKP